MDSTNGVLKFSLRDDSIQLDLGGATNFPDDNLPERSSTVIEWKVIVTRSVFTLKRSGKRQMAASESDWTSFERYPCNRLRMICDTVAPHCEHSVAHNCTIMRAKWRICAQNQRRAHIFPRLRQTCWENARLKIFSKNSHKKCFLNFDTYLELHE